MPTTRNHADRRMQNSPPKGVYERDPAYIPPTLIGSIFEAKNRKFGGVPNNSRRYSKYYLRKTKTRDYTEKQYTFEEDTEESYIPNNSSLPNCPIPSIASSEALAEDAAFNKINDLDTIEPKSMSPSKQETSAAQFGAKSILKNKCAESELDAIYKRSSLDDSSFRIPKIQDKSMKATQSGVKQETNGNAKPSTPKSERSLSCVDLFSTMDVVRKTTPKKKTVKARAPPINSMRVLTVEEIHDKYSSNCSKECASTVSLIGHIVDMNNTEDNIEMNAVKKDDGLDDIFEDSLASSDGGKDENMPTPKPVNSLLEKTISAPEKNNSENNTVLENFTTLPPEKDSSALFSVSDATGRNLSMPERTTPATKPKKITVRRYSEQARSKKQERGVSNGETAGHNFPEKRERKFPTKLEPYHTDVTAKLSSLKSSCDKDNLLPENADVMEHYKKRLIHQLEKPDRNEEVPSQNPPISKNDEKQTNEGSTHCVKKTAGDTETTNTSDGSNSAGVDKKKEVIQKIARRKSVSRSQFRHDNIPVFKLGPSTHDQKKNICVNLNTDKISEKHVPKETLTADIIQAMDGNKSPVGRHNLPKIISSESLRKYRKAADKKKSEPKEISSDKKKDDYKKKLTIKKDDNTKEKSLDKKANDSKEKSTHKKRDSYHKEATDKKRHSDVTKKNRKNQNEKDLHSCEVAGSPSSLKMMIRLNKSNGLNEEVDERSNSIHENAIASMPEAATSANNEIVTGDYDEGTNKNSSNEIPKDNEIVNNTSREDQSSNLVEEIENFIKSTDPKRNQSVTSDEVNTTNSMQSVVCPTSTPNIVIHSIVSSIPSSKLRVPLAPEELRNLLDEKPNREGNQYLKSFLSLVRSSMKSQFCIEILGVLHFYYNELTNLLVTSKGASRCGTEIKQLLDDLLVHVQEQLFGVKNNTDFKNYTRKIMESDLKNHQKFIEAHFAVLPKKCHDPSWMQGFINTLIRTQKHIRIIDGGTIEDTSGEDISETEASSRKALTNSSILNDFYNANTSAQALDNLQRFQQTNHGPSFDNSVKLLNKPLELTQIPNQPFIVPNTIPPIMSTTSLSAKPRKKCMKRRHSVQVTDRHTEQNEYGYQDYLRSHLPPFYLPEHHSRFSMNMIDVAKRYNLHYPTMFPFYGNPSIESSSTRQNPNVSLVNRNQDIRVPPNQLPVSNRFASNMTSNLPQIPPPPYSSVQNKVISPVQVNEVTNRSRLYSPPERLAPFDPRFRHLPNLPQLNNTSTADDLAQKISAAVTRSYSFEPVGLKQSMPHLYHNLTSPKRRNQNTNDSSLPVDLKGVNINPRGSNMDSRNSNLNLGNAIIDHRSTNLGLKSSGMDYIGTQTNLKNVTMDFGSLGINHTRANIEHGGVNIDRGNVGVDRIGVNTTIGKRKTTPPFPTKQIDVELSKHGPEINKSIDPRVLPPQSKPQLAHRNRVPHSSSLTSIDPLTNLSEHSRIHYAAPPSRPTGAYNANGICFDYSRFPISAEVTATRYDPRNILPHRYDETRKNFVSIHNETVPIYDFSNFRNSSDSTSGQANLASKPNKTIDNPPFNISNGFSQSSRSPSHNITMQPNVGVQSEVISTLLNEDLTKNLRKINKVINVTQLGSTNESENCQPQDFSMKKSKDIPAEIVTQSIEPPTNNEMPAEISSFVPYMGGARANANTNIGSTETTLPATTTAETLPATPTAETLPATDETENHKGPNNKNLNENYNNVVEDVIVQDESMEITKESDDKKSFKNEARGDSILEKFPDYFNNVDDKKKVLRSVLEDASNNNKVLLMLKTEHPALYKGLRRRAELKETNLLPTEVITIDDDEDTEPNGSPESVIIEKVDVELDEPPNKRQKLISSTQAAVSNSTPCPIITIDETDSSPDQEITVLEIGEDPPIIELNTTSGRKSPINSTTEPNNASPSPPRLDLCVENVNQNTLLEASENSTRNDTKSNSNSNHTRSPNADLSQNIASPIAISKAPSMELCVPNVSSTIQASSELQNGSVESIARVQLPQVETQRIEVRYTVPGPISLPKIQHIYPESSTTLERQSSQCENFTPFTSNSIPILEEISNDTTVSNSLDKEQSSDDGFVDWTRSSLGTIIGRPPNSGPLNFPMEDDHSMSSVSTTPLSYPMPVLPMLSPEEKKLKRQDIISSIHSDLTSVNTFTKFNSRRAWKSWFTEEDRKTLIPQYQKSRRHSVESRNSVGDTCSPIPLDETSTVTCGASTFVIRKSFLEYIPKGKLYYRKESNTFVKCYSNGDTKNLEIVNEIDLPTKWVFSSEADFVDPGQFSVEYDKVSKFVPKDFSQYYRFVTGYQILNNKNPVSFQTFLEMHNGDRMNTFFEKFLAHLQKGSFSGVQTPEEFFRYQQDL